jgi:hypothetical protein
MRRAAWLVLLTLLSPSIASAICGATCVKAERRVASTAPTSCHRHHASDDRDALIAGGVCHEQPTAATTIIAKLEPPRPQVALHPRTASLFVQLASIVTMPSASFGAPPVSSLVHTPLRI